MPTPMVADLWAAGSHEDFDSTLVVRSGPHDPDSAVYTQHGPKITLAALALRDDAELPRLMLEISGTPYEGRYYGAKAYAAVKSTVPFGQLPALIDYVPGKLTLVRTGPIVRALALRTGLAGQSSLEISAVDMLYESVRDLLVYKDAETWNPAALRSAARGWRANGVSVPHVPLTAALTDDSTEYSNLEKANSVLKFFEEMLDMGSGKALVGTQLTYCDLALWLHLDQLGEADAFPEWAEWLELDQLRSFHLRISRLPLSDRRMPRTVLNDIGAHIYVEGRDSTRALASKLKEFALSPERWESEL